MPPLLEFEPHSPDHLNLARWVTVDTWFKSGNLILPLEFGIRTKAETTRDSFYMTGLLPYRYKNRDGTESLHHNPALFLCRLITEKSVLVIKEQSRCRGEWVMKCGREWPLDSRWLSISYICLFLSLGLDSMSFPCMLLICAPSPYPFKFKLAPIDFCYFIVNTIHLCRHCAYTYNLVSSDTEREDSCWRPPVEQMLHGYKVLGTPRRDF